MADRSMLVCCILDEDGLYRRLHSKCVADDGVTITSATFITDNIPDFKASVDLARLTDSKESVNRADKGGYRLGCILAKDPRSHGHEVKHDPIHGNISHSLIIGISSKSEARKLARLVQLVHGVVSE